MIRESAEVWWNNQYVKDTYIYGEGPNLFLKEHLQELPPGKILLPAEGEGRNAVFAAQQGWDVHAVDFSTEGKRKALKLAELAGVEIDYQVHDLVEFEPPEASYDAVAVIYMHLHKANRKVLFPKLLRALKPGGIFLMEVFHQEQLGRDSGGPPNMEMLYSEFDTELLLQSLEVQAISKEEVTLKEGPRHDGPAVVVRAIARKPPQ